jgi:hypothetical protein
MSKTSQNRGCTHAHTRTHTYTDTHGRGREIPPPLLPQRLCVSFRRKKSNTKNITKDVNITTCILLYKKKTQQKKLGRRRPAVVLCLLPLLLPCPVCVCVCVCVSEGHADWRHASHCHPTQKNYIFLKKNRAKTQKGSLPFLHSTKTGFLEGGRYFFKKREKKRPG